MLNDNAANDVQFITEVATIPPALFQRLADQARRNTSGAAAPDVQATLPGVPAASARTKPCAECAAAFPVIRGKRQLFCGNPCKQTNENRWTVRGKRLVVLLMASRQTRDGTRGTTEQRTAGRKAAAMMRELMQAIKDEDAAAGRADALSLFTARLKMGHLDR